LTAETTSSLQKSYIRPLTVSENQVSGNLIRADQGVPGSGARGRVL